MRSAACLTSVPASRRASETGRLSPRGGAPRGAQVKEARLAKVQLEGHVVLKIVKHCQECAPDLVTGQLLGLDVRSTLEVTDAFPFPVRPPSDLARPLCPCPAPPPRPPFVFPSFGSLSGLW